MHAHRVPFEASDQEAFENSGLKWQWWMVAIIAVTLLTLVLLALWLRKMLRAGKTVSGKDTAGAAGTEESVGAEKTDKYTMTDFEQRPDDPDPGATR